MKRIPSQMNESNELPQRPETRGRMVVLFGVTLGVLAISILWLPRGRMVAQEWKQVSGPNRQSEPLPGLMLAKLASTQRIVSGLVSKDFSEIRRGAEDMVRICDASQWESHPDQVFGHHRTELRRQSIRLKQMAEEENLDGAAFNYMQTVSTCISCHAHCRDVLRIAEAQPRSRVIPIPAAEEEVGWSGMPTLRR